MIHFIIRHLKHDLTLASELHLPATAGDEVQSYFTISSIISQLFLFVLNLKNFLDNFELQ